MGVRTVLVVGIVALAQVMGGAQTSPSPVAGTVEREDSHVRVVRQHLAPNQALPMHEEPARVVITLTANELVITNPDGTRQKVNSPAGQVTWRDAGKVAVQNGDSELENIVVEMKLADGPAKPVAAAPNPKPATYLDEPHHHWLFENQYVRAYDVDLPAGETTEFHLHSFDAVAVHLTPGLASSQEEGGEWIQPKNLEGDAVELTHDSKRPRSHRIRNLGNKEIRVLMVQILATD